MAVAAAAVLEWRRKWRNFEVELEIILFIFHGGVRWLSDSVAEREREEEEEVEVLVVEVLFFFL